MSGGARAVLFRAGGLGDLLVALPAVSLVRRALPGSHLTLAALPEYGALFKAAGIVDEAAAFDDPRLAAFFGGGQAHAGFDLAFGWLNRRGDWPSGTLSVPYDPGSGVPMSKYFFERTLEILQTLPPASRPGPASLFDDCARLDLPGALVRKAFEDLHVRPRGGDEKRLVVHPGSGGRAKRWPLENFVEVVRRAAARGVPGVLATGEAEADLEPVIGRTALPAGWSHAARLAAETLAGLLAGSTHYIGNDSGPTHLAAACGASVLALFRDDNLPAWRPFGRTRVLSAPAVERVQLAAVLAEMDDLLGA